MLKKKILFGLGLVLCAAGGSTYGYWKVKEMPLVKDVASSTSLAVSVPSYVGESERLLAALRIIQVNAVVNAKAWRRVNPATVQGVPMYVVVRDTTMQNDCLYGSGWVNVMVGVDTRATQTYVDLMCPSHTLGQCEPLASFRKRVGALSCAGVKKVARLD